MIVGRKPDTEPSVRFMHEYNNYATINVPKSASQSPTPISSIQNSTHSNNISLPITQCPPNTIPSYPQSPFRKIIPIQLRVEYRAFLLSEEAGLVRAGGKEEEYGYGEEEGWETLDEEEDSPG